MITKTNALFFLRHCKTVNNVKDIITGCKEVAVLSDQKVYKDNLTFQKKMTILCSPLSRCKETVELLTPSLNFVPNIVICDELTERSMGELEGIPYEYPEVKNTEVRKKKKVGRNESCPCGSGKKFKKCCIGKEIYD